jgi:hypothetical protein
MGAYSGGGCSSNAGKRAVYEHEWRRPLWNVALDVLKMNLMTVAESCIVCVLSWFVPWLGLSTRIVGNITNTIPCRTAVPRFIVIGWYNHGVPCSAGVEKNLKIGGEAGFATDCI